MYLFVFITPTLAFPLKGGGDYFFILCVPVVKNHYSEKDTS
jgi:hypothetical protein